MTLQTTCSVFGARGLQTHRATGAPCAPGKIASSSYRMKARDLTSGLPALPVGLSEILQTANQRAAVMPPARGLMSEQRIRNHSSGSSGVHQATKDPPRNRAHVPPGTMVEGTRTRAFQ